MLKLREKLAEYLRRKLFAGEYSKLELARRTVDGKNTQEQIQLLTRANLATFDIKRLDSHEDVLVLMEQADFDETFLSLVADLKKNYALQEIVAYLKREQIAFTAKEATDIDQVNFSRGSINGVVLLEDTIDRLYGVYQERTSPDEEYDNHEII